MPVGETRKVIMKKNFINTVLSLGLLASGIFAGIVIEGNRNNEISDYIIQTKKNMYYFVESAKNEFDSSNQYPKKIDPLNSLGAKIEYEQLNDGTGFGVYIVFPEMSFYSKLFGMRDEYTELMKLPLVSYVSYVSAGSSD